MQNVAAGLEAKLGANKGEIRTFFCPGRVNLIGEHIDYNGGYVFPAAIGLGIAAAARLRTDDTFHVYSANFDKLATIDRKTDALYDKSLGWANYIKGVLVFLAEKGYNVPTMDIYIKGDLPNGAGLSSSASLEVLIGYLALRMGGMPDAEIDRVWLAQSCQAVENKFIGVNCGIMDQYSVANGKKGFAMLLDCQTLEASQVQFQLGIYSLIIMNTNKKRQLADSKYNERRAECERALEQINRFHSYPDLCSAMPEDIDDFVKDIILKKRAIHVVSEQRRVLSAVEVLQEGDLAKFGTLLNGSHRSLKEDYEVTGTELDTLVAAAQAQPNCLGARMTGAGFGGCALALVKTSEVPTFMSEVGAAYKIAIGYEATFFESFAEDGVHETTKA